MLQVWSSVLIPFNSGLRFGPASGSIAAPPIRLNPLQFGSKVRSEFRQEIGTQTVVLIPFNSGLRFGLTPTVTPELITQS